MLNVIFSYCYADCRHALCRYAECRYADCHSAVELSYDLRVFMKSTNG
jgi:hypothetical protein